MEELKKLLLQADDEYLTGLCNKGTVKRAYKDLGEEDPSAEWQEDGAEVRLKEAVCRIRVPLGESSCSCPSRSVCRHLIAAILYLKQGLEGEGKVLSSGGLAKSGQEAAVQDGYGDNLGQENPGGQADEQGRKLQHKQASGQGQTSQCQPEDCLLKELSKIPLASLKRACKARVYQRFVAHIKAGELPKIQSGTVLTVHFPWEEAVVKLLAPLEYSTCTCHSRELCAHKAQAILAVGLSKGVWDMGNLEKLLEEKSVWDAQVLAQAAGSMKEVLCLQLMTGLSRLSPEAEESMERLAVISHSAQLPAFEAGFRVAAGEYRRFFERRAAFRAEKLTGRLLGLYRRALLLEKEKEPGRLRSLAGSFRDTYHPISRLHLTAIGARSIQSKTGYEGESYYFLEVEQGKWYTWTDVRPVFYEGVRRRPIGKLGQAAAPWGLGCSREQMMDLEFFLEQGKATEDGRLSASQYTKSEIAGTRNLKRDGVRRMIFWDYHQLLQDHFQNEEERAKWEPDSDRKHAERLALVGARCVQEPVFDQVEQRFTMKLLDRAGRCIRVAVKYSEEERMTIRVLERLSLRLEGQEGVAIVFFGIPYLEQGQLYLYPIEFFEGEGLAEEGDLEETDSCGGEAKARSFPEPQMLRRMEVFLSEIREASSSLFQCGLNSLQEGTLAELCRLAGESEELGLHRLGQELAFLAKELGGKHHGRDFDPEPVLASWIRLEGCLDFCLEKLALDSARAGMEEVQVKKG